MRTSPGAARMSPRRASAIRPETSLRSSPRSWATYGWAQKQPAADADAVLVAEYGGDESWIPAIDTERDHPE